MSTSLTPATPAALAEAVRAHPRVLAVGARTKPRLSQVPGEVTLLSTRALRGIVEYEPEEFISLILFLHNHWWEFETIDGGLKYDVLAELAPRVSFELDTYWAANFGAVDPAAVLKRHARRTPLLHIKDGPLVRDKPMVAVGSGKMNFRPILAAADPAVLRWLVVEMDECATDMLQAVKASYDWLVGQGMATGRKSPVR